MAEQYHPGLDGVVAAETAVSFLDVEQEAIVIRGYDLIELARRCHYVDVAHLLLRGHLPDDEERRTFAEELATAGSVPAVLGTILGSLPQETHPMDGLRTGISALSGFDPELEDLSLAANARKSVRLLAKIPALIAWGWRLQAGLPVVSGRSDLGFADNFLWMLTGSIPDAEAARAFDQLLVVYSEHEMPNSTFTARVIASTQADIYGAFTGAVASLKGSWHGGANEAVMRLLLQAGNADGLERLMMQKLQQKERIMGFGHRVYMNKPDPRAVLMKETLGQLVKTRGREDLVEMCQRGESVMLREKGLYPNLDYYAAPVYYLLEIPIPLYTPIFFAARAAGLGAHVMEQHANNRLFRPRVRYLGPRGLHP